MLAGLYDDVSVIMDTYISSVAARLARIEMAVSKLDRLFQNNSISELMAEC